MARSKSRGSCSGGKPQVLSKDHKPGSSHNAYRDSLVLSIEKWNGVSCEYLYATRRPAMAAPGGHSSRLSLTDAIFISTLSAFAASLYLYRHGALYQPSCLATRPLQKQLAPERFHVE